MFKRSLLFAVGIFSINLAHAAVYAGNPGLILTAEITGEVITSGTMEIDRIVLHACDGSTWTNGTDVSMDPTSGATWAIPAGDWCNIAVWWGEDVVLTATDENGTFDLTYKVPRTFIALDPATVSVPLTPYSVSAGTAPSGHPRLQAQIN